MQSQMTQLQTQIDRKQSNDQTSGRSSDTHHGDSESDSTNMQNEGVSIQQENKETRTLIQSLRQQTTEPGETVTKQQSQLHDKQQTIDSLTAEKEEDSNHISRENPELKQANARLRTQKLHAFLVIHD